MIAKIILRTTFVLAVPQVEYIQMQEIAAKNKTSVEEIISEEFMTRITGCAAEGTPLAKQRKDYNRLVDAVEIINIK